LDFIGGAVCDTGIVQRRGEPKKWNANRAPLDLPQIPELSDAERAEHDRVCAAIRDAALPEAQVRRAAWVEERRAAGHPVAATWHADGSLESLDGGHAIELEDGTWATVDEILADAVRFHEKRCADPLEPEYGGHDRRIAQIFTIGQREGPAIHSFAHGGTVYMLRPSAEADFRADSADTPTFATEYEALASLVGDAGRVLLLAMAAAGPADDLWPLNDQLEQAVTKAHPHRRTLDEVVLPAAKSVRAFVTDAAQFERLLVAHLTGEPRWTGLLEADRGLLARAAYLIFAPPDQLVGADARKPRLVPRHVEPRPYVVDPIVPALSLIGLVGPPGSGKSTLASAAGALIGTPPFADPLTAGTELTTFGAWRATHGLVLSFLSEDKQGRSAWLERWAAVYGDPTHLHVFDGVPPLSSVSASLAFIRSALALVRTPTSPPLELIIIDLFRDSFQGDENSSADVGSAMATARAIARMFRCAVMLVHHAAIADEKRARGSSAFLGALDVCCAVGMRDGTITLTVTKNRMGPTGQAFHWHLDNEGLLRVGAGAPAAGDVTEDAARAVAQVVHEIADASSPVARQDLKAALAEARPGLFGGELKANTVRSRFSRAIKAARDANWIMERRGKYLPGPQMPDVLLPVGTLEGVLS
jgi:hypothetical protein